jgi:hypothetical protein
MEDVMERTYGLSKNSNTTMIDASSRYIKTKS